MDDGNAAPAVSAARRWLEVAAWAGTLALAAAVAVLAVGLAAKLYAIARTGYTFMLGAALTGWRTVLLVALVVPLWKLWGRTPALPSFRRLAAHRWRWAVAIAAAGAFAYHVPSRPPNALGIGAAPPHAEMWIDRGHPHRPPALVRTNQYGFRSHDWTPAPRDGVVRVLVVGDSYVFGSGVPEADGTIDRQLGRALGALRPDRRWEVLNAGIPGWGLVTYFEVARRLLAAFHPRVVVIGTIGWSDWDFLDPQQILEVFGPAHDALVALGAVQDVREMSLRCSRGVTKEYGTTGQVHGEKEVAQALAALLEDAAAEAVDVVVWEYYDPLPLLDDVEGTPRFHRAGWPEGFPRGWDGWGNDPVLAIPVDRHPTAEGNRLVAQHLAPVVARASGGPESAAAREASR